MNKKILLFAFVLLIFNVSAWSNSTFNNSLSTENLTFSVVNFKGYSTVAQVIDFNYSSYNSSSNDIFVNFTRIANTSGGANLSWTGSTTRATGGTAYCKNQTSGSFISLGDMFNLGVQNGSAVMPIQCLSNPTIETKFSIVAPDNCGLCSGVEYFREVDINTTYLYSTTRYLSVPTSVYALTSGYLNLSKITFTCSQESVNVSNQTGTDGICGQAYNGTWERYNNAWINSEYAYDGDYSTLTKPTIGPEVGRFLFNYTKPYGAYGASWYVKYVISATNQSNISIIPIPAKCWNAYPDNIALQYASNQIGCIEGVYSCFNGTGINNGEILINSSFCGIYEESVIWNTTYPATDLFFNIAGTRIQTFLGAFNYTNNRTSNVANYITNYLNSNYLVGSNYLIPFNFFSSTAGIIQYSSMLFSNEGFSENSITYTNPTYETKEETFILNFTVSNPISTSANLYYNGTTYASTTSCSGNNCIATNTFGIPLITGSQQNNSFYWAVTVFDGTTSYLQNSTTSVQSVNALTLTQCTSGTIALNFTAWDEQNRTRISPFSFDGEFDYSLGSTTQRNLTISISNATEVLLCVNFNSTYYIDSIIAYDEQPSSTSYTTRNWFYQHYPISNNTQKVPMYLLRTSQSTSFILQVQDQNALPVPQFLVNSQRCYPGLGINETVFISRTDNNGLTTGNFEAETALYQFFITNQSQTVLAVTPCSAVVPQTTPYTLLFQLGSSYTSPFNDIENTTDITSTLYYNATNNFVSWTYIDTSGEFVNATMIVRNLNYSGSNNRAFCTQSSNVSSATLSCNVSTAGTYSAQVYVYRTSSTLIDQLIFTVETFSSTAGYYGVFLAFFLVLVCGFMFKWNEIAGVWMIVVSLIFINYIGIWAIGAVGLTAVICIAVVITAILER